MEQVVDNKQKPTNVQTVPVRTGVDKSASAVGAKTIMKEFPKAKGKNTLLLVVASLLVVVAGVGTGWLLSGGALASKEENVSKEAASQMVQSENEAGLADESLFSDEVEGTLVEGGIKGEGTHHLEREGGPSQNVYLTSTVIDLQSFVGKKVMVWGETLSGQTAGWLMDVGKIKVIE